MKLSINKSLQLALFFLASCLLTFSSCKLADIRNDYVKDKSKNRKGKNLLKKMNKAHGSKKWRDIDTYEAIFHDEFYGILKHLANPFPKGQVDFKLEFIPTIITGRGTFLSGKKEGEVWGIQDWETYLKKPNQELVFEENKNIKFWLPTYQYFIELPNRIQEATVIQYGGKQMFKDKEYEVVYATWKREEPQKDIDQYMLWIDAETNLLAFVEYTVRDAYKFWKGVTFYDEYHDIDGLKIPKTMNVKLSKKKKKLFHQMSVKSFKINTIAKEELLPKE